ncbi:PKD domain-containing protein, partial [Polaribacter sp.]|nr:PKD domain-containing protein [Polaribacter sp.]
MHAISKNTIDFKEEKVNKIVKEDRSALSAAVLATTLELDLISDSCNAAIISPGSTYTTDCETAGTPDYEWSFPDGNPSISTAENPQDIEYTTPGVYTVSLTVTNACGFVATTSRTFEIFATPIIDINSSSDIIQEVCQTETAPTLTITATNDENSSYQWYSNTIDESSGGSLLNSQTNTTYTPPTNVVGTVFYYAVVSTPECGDQPGPTSEITVTPKAVITSQPNSSSLCVNAAAPQLSVTTDNNGGIPIYKWYQNSIASLVNANEILGTNSPNFTPTSTAATNYYFVKIVIGSCETISDIATIQVFEVPVISPAANITTYSGQVFSFNPSVANNGNNSVPAGTTYTWSAPSFSPNGAITGALAQTAGANISQVLTNNGNTTVAVTYEITPINGSCAGTPFSVQTNVTAPLTSNAVVTNVSCFPTDGFTNDGQINTMITGGTTPYLIAWTGPDTFESNSPNINNLAPGVYTLNIEDDDNNVLLQEQYTITAPAIDAITDSNTTAICYNDTPAPLTVNYTGSAATPSYRWYKNTIGSNLPADSEPITGATNNNYVPTETDLAGNETVYFFATIQLGTCTPKASEVFSINVLPSAVITTQPIVQQIVCEGTSP